MYSILLPYIVANGIHSFCFSFKTVSQNHPFIKTKHYSLRESLEIPTLKGVKTKINEIVPNDSIEAVRIRHISLASSDLARDCLGLLKSSNIDFVELAKNISLCEHSKDNGGDLGWLSLNSYDGPSNFHLEPKVVSRQIVSAAYGLNKGDIIIAKSNEESNSSPSCTWHIIQLLDVQTKLNTLLTKRRSDNFLSMKGVYTSSSAKVKENHIESTTISHKTQSSPLTYTMETMGCQMNFADSERIEGQLRDMGYSRIEDSTRASLVLFNTCSIREHAEQKVYSHIGPHAQRKRRGEDVSIIVTGCVAQQEGEALTKRFPEVDVVMGPQYSNRMADILEAVADGWQVVVTDPTYQSEDSTLPNRRSAVSAWVNVIYGCNERCTYCVVPNTRGVEQSRTKEAILEEVTLLASLGYREITLLGQNIDAWGRDMSPKQLFADLLTAVGNVAGIERVRFLTSHPKYMSPRVISAVAANPRVLAPNFNVPFQSGDDEVLKAMRRGYSRERYLEIVANIRSVLPDAAITADVIVGFPGETEEQFERTLELMREVKFDLVNTAAYSPRPNTPAATWTNAHLSEEVKQDRLQRINRLATEHAQLRSERFLGRTQDVLVEDVNPKAKRAEQVIGRNEHGRLVFFEGDITALKGKFVPVNITEARPYSLTGVQVGEPR